MNFNNLYYFKVLAEYEHYTKAAEYLCITQPSLSHAISSLEEELGVKLFERYGRNVRLNKYGHLYNSYISRGFNDLELGTKIVEQYAKINSGIIDISFLFVLGYQFIPKLIKIFYENALSNYLTINFTQCSTNTSIKKLNDGLIDISFCTFMPDKADIKFTPIFRQNLVCITSLEHPLSSMETVLVEELKSYPIIKYNDSVGEIQHIIDTLFFESQLTPLTYGYLDEEVTMAGIVSSGHNNCIAIVPDLEILQSYNIKKIRIANPNAHRDIYMATSMKHTLPSYVELFYEFVIDHFASF